jgi:hypothetical protein
MREEHDVVIAHSLGESYWPGSRHDGFDKGLEQAAFDFFPWVSGQHPFDLGGVPVTAQKKLHAGNQKILPVVELEIQKKVAILPKFQWVRAWRDWIALPAVESGGWGGTGPPAIRKRHVKCFDWKFES